MHAHSPLSESSDMRTPDYARMVIIWSCMKIDCVLYERERISWSILFLQLYFLVLIGQHDCASLLNGDPTVYYRVFKNELMVDSILNSVTEFNVINIIISVFVPLLFFSSSLQLLQMILLLSLLFS